MTSFALFLTLSVAAVMAAPAIAQDTAAPNRADHDSEILSEAGSVQRIALGLELAAYARSIGDADAMVVAAELVGSLRFQSENETGQSARIKRDALLNEAEAMAAGDDALLERIIDLRASEAKGCVGTCSRTMGSKKRVEPGTVWSTTFTARGGEPFLVAAQRDAETGVDMKVYDENDFLMCQDLSLGRVMRCQVTPIWTGPIRVDLLNHGAAATGLKLVTN